MVGVDFELVAIFVVVAVEACLICSKQVVVVVVAAAAAQAKAIFVVEVYLPEAAAVVAISDYFEECLLRFERMYNLDKTI